MWNGVNGLALYSISLLSWAQVPRGSSELPLPKISGTLLLGRAEALPTYIFSTPEAVQNLNFFARVDVPGTGTFQAQVSVQAQTTVQGTITRSGLIG